MSTNEVTEVKKSKEQSETETEIAALVKSREEASLCACTEICITKILSLKEARKTMNDTKHKCKCECDCNKNPDTKCFCHKTCLDDVLGTTCSYVRELSKPPYTNWNGVLTCPAGSIYADHLTEFKPEKVKEGDDKEVKDKIKERNQKKGVRFTHAGKEMVRGYWASPEPEFWLGRLVC